MWRRGEGGGSFFLINFFLDGAGGLTWRSVQASCGIFLVFSQSKSLSLITRKLWVSLLEEVGRGRGKSSTKRVPDEGRKKERPRERPRKNDPRLTSQPNIRNVQRRKIPRQDKTRHHRPPKIHNQPTLASGGGGSPCPPALASAPLTVPCPPESLALSP